MTVRIEYEAEDKLEIPWEELIQKVVAEALDDEGCPYEAEVSVLLTEDEEIRQMNAQFRSLDKTTDVLSFPAVEFPAPGDFSCLEEPEAAFCFHPETGELMLGDIAISVSKVREQAAAYGHSLERELAFLVAHSMFHLMGYDHLEEEEREIMEQKQREVLDRLGITR